MDAKQKREQLKRVPTRKLLAAIKKDIRRQLSATASQRSLAKEQRTEAATQRDMASLMRRKSKRK